MKKIIITAITAATLIVANAQNEDDALRFSMDRFSGTARSVALGGAMGALGGDLSSIAINPAGIAVYRSSEFTFTPSLMLNKTNTSYHGNSNIEDRYSLPFQEIGFVGTYKPIREATNGIVSSHFSIGYNRTNSFSRSLYLHGDNMQYSLLDRFTHDANAGRLGGIYKDVLEKSWLLYEEAGYVNAFEFLYPNNEVGFGPLSGIDQVTAVRERGNAGEFHFAGGLNISNKFMLGASLGINSFNYSRKTQHFEAVSGYSYANWYGWEYYEYQATCDPSGVGLDKFTFSDNLSTVGVGVNLKVGVIYKPINAIRIGAAFHSPVFYSIDEDFSTSARADYFYVDISDDGSEYLFEPAPSKGDKKYGDFKYNFRTPLKGVGSVAFILGKMGLISIDYEYVDYSSMRFATNNSDLLHDMEIKEMNKPIPLTFKETHNFRFGAEFRPSEIFTLRGGYGMYQSPYRKEFLNADNKHQTFSFGFGYRMNNMFIDVAYMLRQEKYLYSFYNLDDVFYIQEKPQSADITSNNHQMAVTLGWRF